jgi:pantoate--beta-alanine ligase
MQTIRTIKQLQVFLHSVRRQGKKIRFVPTMGALHEGHLALVRGAKKDGGVVVVSIFVNPLQFGPNEDLARYPRHLKRDQQLLKNEGVDFLFSPDVKEMYSEESSVYINEDNASRYWCGQYRPGHFKGVLTIVAKLFHIVAPDTAYFGQKDFQQLFLIEKMCRDLFLPVKIKRIPTVREKEGLALSSRNLFLSAAQKKQALGLVRGLRQIRQTYLNGVTQASKLKKAMFRVLREHPQLKLQYLGFASKKNLKPVAQIKKGDVVLVAAFIGKTRLIDNWVVGKKI